VPFVPNFQTLALPDAVAFVLGSLLTADPAPPMTKCYAAHMRLPSCFGLSLPEVTWGEGPQFANT
jgi:hypothetical protein